MVCSCHHANDILANAARCSSESLDAKKPNCDVCKDSLLQARTGSRANLQTAPSIHCLKTRSRNREFIRKQAVKTNARRPWSRDVQGYGRPIRGNGLRRELLHDKIRMKIDTTAMSPERNQIEFPFTQPVPIALLHCSQICCRDRRYRYPFGERPVPTPVACNALIDEPCVQPASVGIQPDLAARNERPGLSASAALSPWVGRSDWFHRPVDIMCSGHVALAFHSEVRHGGDGRVHPTGCGVAITW